MPKCRGSYNRDGMQISSWEKGKERFFPISIQWRKHSMLWVPFFCFLAALHANCQIIKQTELLQEWKRPKGRLRIFLIQKVLATPPKSGSTSALKEEYRETIDNLRIKLRHFPISFHRFNVMPSYLMGLSICLHISLTCSSIWSQRYSGKIQKLSEKALKHFLVLFVLDKTTFKGLNWEVR